MPPGPPPSTSASASNGTSNGTSNGNSNGNSNSRRSASRKAPAPGTSPAAPAPNESAGPDVSGTSAPLHIDAAARRVFLAGEAVDLTGRAFDLLLLLASEPGRVFSAQELMAAVWPGRVVEGNNLRVQVAALRKQLGPALVVNVAGKGYLLAQPAALAAAGVAPSPRGNVPHHVEPLLGREAELAELAELVSRQRLVSLLGAGGIGKTRLALQLALQLAPAPAEGAWWVDLAAQAAGPGALPRVAQAVARALGRQLAGLEGEAAARNLGLALAGCKGLLLVLDNAEHLAPEVALLVQALLQQGPGVRVLVTSQRALRMAEEWTFWLEALAVPAPGATPAEVRQSPALQLLLRRATAADQRFVLAEAQLPLAAELVRALDGNALAIEMAAVRLPLLGLEPLVQRLGQRLRLLGGDADSVLPKHRTLRAALDWSYDLLSPAEKGALRSLSVFAAPFCVESAQAVLAVNGLDGVSALELVRGLVNKSMLQSQPSARPGLPPRLRMLESTRLYAAEALQREGERDSAENRHVRAMAELARQAKHDLNAAPDDEWRARWLPDQEDQMQAFDRASVRGDADSASEVMELLVLAATITGQVAPAVERMLAARRLAEAAPPLPRARLLSFSMPQGIGGISRLAMAEQRLQAWLDVGDAKGICAAQASMALALEAAGEPARAEAALAQCLALEDPAWPPRLRRRCSWLALSGLVLSRDNPALLESATVRSRALLAQLEVMGAKTEATSVRGFLVQTLRLQRRPQEALQLLPAVLKEYGAVGRTLEVGQYLGITCAALLEVHNAPETEQERLRAARSFAAQALQQLQPFPVVSRHFLEPLALLACRSGDAPMGATLLAAAGHVRRTAGIATDVLNSRAAAQAQAGVQALPAAVRQQQQQLGEGCSLDDLLRMALQWLARFEAQGAAA